MDRQFKLLVLELLSALLDVPGATYADDLPQRVADCIAELNKPQK